MVWKSLTCLATLQLSKEPSQFRFWVLTVVSWHSQSFLLSLIFYLFEVIILTKWSNVCILDTYIHVTSGVTVWAQGCLSSKCVVYMWLTLPVYMDLTIMNSFFFSLLFEQLNLDRLLSRMWEEMGLVRVYTKPQGQQPDFSDPVVLSAVCTTLPFPFWNPLFM